MAIALLVALVAGVDAQPAKVKVFIGPQTRQGFVDVDQGVIDSIKDVQSELRTSKDVELVTSTADATVVIDVVGRRIAGNAGSVGVPVGAMTVFLPIKARAIDWVLHVGTYDKPFTSEDQDHDQWKAAAKQVAKDLTAWIQANRARLIK